MIQPWKKNKDWVDYDCGFFKVHVHRSASPTTGKEHPFFVLSTRDWINIVALTKEKKVIMVSQYRHGTGEVSLEVPGGAVDEGEPPLEAAKRELREETGYESSQWHALGVVRPNPAILSNTCHLFLALDAERTTELDLDEAEELEVSLHDLKEISQMIRDGHIQHSLVVAAFYFFELFDKESSGKKER
ncbi:MAG TPA: NUDIX hydrolase [bacterium]|nr:NUDIX hydrolase [bacterium]